MPAPFSLARSTWAGTVARLMTPGASRPFIQPYHEMISTLPENTGLPMGGLGNSFTLTPAGTTPVLNLLGGLHVTPLHPAHLRLHNFFYCEREPATGAALMFPDYYAFQRRTRMYPLADPRGVPWLSGEESQEQAHAILQRMIATPSLYADNAERFARWRVDWSPRTRRALARPDTSEHANILVLLDYYRSALGVAHRFGRSLTGDHADLEIDGWETYRSDLMTYRALYPLAETNYLNRRQSLRLTKRTYTPLICGDEASCTLPVSVVDFEIFNPGRRPLEATLIQTIHSLCGYHVIKERAGVQDGWFRLVPTANFMQHAPVDVGSDAHQRLTGFSMAQRADAETGDLAGRMLAGICHDERDEDLSVTVNAAYSRDRIGHAVSDGMHSGRLTPGYDQSMYTGREPLTGALCATVRLAPGARKTVSFVLTLDFPELRLPWNRTRKRYTAQFPQADTRTLDVTLAGLRLRERSLAAAAGLHRKLGEAPGLDLLYPPADQAARDRFLTCLCNLLAFYADAVVWTENDDFLIRESADYPFFNVLDVYFYGAFSLPWVAPRVNGAILLRFAAAILAEDPTLRRYWHYTEEPFADLPDAKLEGPRAIAGAVPHDLGSAFDCRPDAYIWHNVKEWKDLAPKYVLLVLRHFRTDGSREFLEQCWPAVYAAIEHLSAQRLPGETIPRTRGTDDTFDNLDSRGISAYSGSLWIAGLQAASEIARILGKDAAGPWHELAGQAREQFVAALWDEAQGCYHFCVSPAGTPDLQAGANPELAVLLGHLGEACGEDRAAVLGALNRLLDSDSVPHLEAGEWARVRAWAEAHCPRAVPLLGTPAGLPRKERRALKKVMLAGLAPRLWTAHFIDGIFLDSDHVLAAQLLADTWLELLDLPAITPLARRRRVLQRIRALNFRTHSPELGAANLVDRAGASLGAYQAQEVWLGVQFSLAVAMILADMPDEARELTDICCVNLYDKARIPFAAPEGFNGSSPLSAADLRAPLKLTTPQAEALHRALQVGGMLDAEGRVSAALPESATDLAAALPADVVAGWPARRADVLLNLLHSWRLRYTAGRYHRPGMAFCILEALERKMRAGS